MRHLCSFPQRILDTTWPEVDVAMNAPPVLVTKATLAISRLVLVRCSPRLPAQRVKMIVLLLCPELLVLLHLRVVVPLLELAKSRWERI